MCGTDFTAQKKAATGGKVAVTVLKSLGYCIITATFSAVDLYHLAGVQYFCDCVEYQKFMYVCICQLNLSNATSRVFQMFMPMEY